MAINNIFLSAKLKLTVSYFISIFIIVFLAVWFYSSNPIEADFNIDDYLVVGLILFASFFLANLGLNPIANALKKRTIHMEETAKELDPSLKEINEISRTLLLDPKITKNSPAQDMVKKINDISENSLAQINHLLSTAKL